MAQVDNAPGSHAAGALGGRGGGGGDRGGGRRGSDRGGRGPSGHYRQHSDHLMDLMEVSKTTLTSDMEFVQNSGRFSVQRPLLFKEGRSQPLDKHPSYSAAATIQTYGGLNNVQCTSCDRGAGAFSNGCVSFHRGDGRNDQHALFGGACGNCFWGGQGSRCTLRKGGATKPLRKIETGDLFQTSLAPSTHLGSAFDLNTEEGCRQAFEDLQKIQKALQARAADIKKGKAVADVTTEEVDYDAASFEGFSDSSSVSNESGPASIDAVMTGTTSIRTPSAGFPFGPGSPQQLRARSGSPPASPGPSSSQGARPDSFQGHKWTGQHRRFPSKDSN